MLHDYGDIRDRISEPAKWWDESGVPRYSDFAPRETANIYADECALVQIACQNCGTRFDVAFSRSKSFAVLEGDKATLADRIRDGSLHYGDPPNTACCLAGPTMNCDDLRVIEYWHQEKFESKRDETLEIALEPCP